MSDSHKYKIMLSVVWMQIVLLPVFIFMVEYPDNNQHWRWSLDTWVFIVGFLLGLVAFPLGRGLEKPKILKWWLYVDFAFSLILLLPTLVIASSFVPDTIAEQGDYIVYRMDGIVANREAYLARKSGLFNNLIWDLWPYEGGRLNEKNYRFDEDKGYFYGYSIYSPRKNGSRIWIIPIDTDKYAKNKQYISQLIDSVFYAHGKWIENDNATFVLPDDFSRIDYKKGNISFLNKSEWTIDYSYSDCVIYESYYPSDMEIKQPKDSLGLLSPIQARNTINELERNNGFDK